MHRIDIVKCSTQPYDAASAMNGNISGASSVNQKRNI